ncbi:MAG: F0F1 ATP synthase subunit B' [Alphaproteobacteria bacterium]|nr:F0F1 ATP synthase subunit B' [Alphaproteobacteria bacterium]
MPQFDPTMFPSQIFWLVVTFVALYLIIARFAIPRVGEILEQRARLIQDDLDRAKQLKADSDKALATYEKAMADARAQARDVLLAVTNEMKAVVDQKTAAVTAEVTKQIADAETRIGKAKSDALAQIRSIASDTAKEAVGKLAGLSVDGAKLDAAVAGALKDAR